MTTSPDSEDAELPAPNRSPGDGPSNDDDGDEELPGLAPAELLAWGLDSIPALSPARWEPPDTDELQRLLPQYEVNELVGRGGMGAVYRAVQPQLGRPVAIKLLPASLAEDQNFVARFKREARTLAGLDHPGIIQVFEFGETPGGHLYFVMEFVDGSDLHRMIHGPGLSPNQALDLICQICDALQFAHGKGVVHRDIKPANILVTREGRAKLADFGLARPLEYDLGQLTRSHVVMGTPDYMAPEQKRGEGDHRVDLYSLGVMLYEMLCGRTPQGAWQAPSRRVLVDVRLDEVVIKAMQEEPGCRYQQASEVKTDVERIRNTTVVLPPEKLPGRSLRKLLLVFLACLIPVIAFGAWFAFRPQSPHVSDVSPAAAPVVHLSFDETTGTTAADVSGNGKAGILAGGATWVPGRNGNAVRLNGSKQFVQLPAGIVSACDDCTIAAWVKPDRIDTWSRVFDFGSGANRYLFLTPENGANGKLRFAITTGGGNFEQRIDGTSALPQGLWSHVAVTLSGTTGTLYVNGVPVGENLAMTLRPSQLGSTSKNYLGHSQFPPDPDFNGLVDDFRIYDRALTATELVEAARLAMRLPSDPPGKSTGVAGAVDPSWQPAADNNMVVSMATQPDGKVLIGGNFTGIGGVARDCLARLNPDGTLDTGFSPEVDGEVVNIIVQDDGKIVIGGLFAEVNGEPRTGLARLNADGSLDSDFNLNADCFVYGLTEAPDGKILLTGGFKDIGGVTMNGMARLDRHGLLDTSFANPQLNNTASCIVVQEDGKIVVTGDFTTAGGRPRQRIARFNRDGTLDPDFDPGANAWVYAAAPQPDGKLLLGGAFTFIGDQPRHRIARLNADGSLDPDFHPDLDRHVFGIALQANGSMLVHGVFTAVNGQPRERVARLNADGSLDAYPDVTVDAEVRSAVLQPDGHILLGGAFLTVDGWTRSRLARLANKAAGSAELTVPAPGRIVWTRTGSAPEAISTSFQLSTDHGSSWSPLGTGIRAGTGWEKVALDLPSAGMVRARARIQAGNFNGSSGIVEQVASFPISSAPPAEPIPEGERKNANPALESRSLPAR